MKTIIVYSQRLLLPRRATSEHAGKSGMQFSVVAEMEAYGDQAAASSKELCCKFGEEPSRKP